MEASRRHRAPAVFVFAFVLVGALTTGANADCPLSSPAARAVAASGLTAAFQDADFEVAQGAMWFFKHSDIDEDCEDCYYANPSSTYGCPLLVRSAKSLFVVCFVFWLSFWGGFFPQHLFCPSLKRGSVAED